MTAEYSFGMEEFDEVGAREPRELEAKPEVLDTWGSVPDPRFGKGGAILTHGRRCLSEPCGNRHRRRRRHRTRARTPSRGRVRPRHVCRSCRGPPPETAGQEARN